ncbi:VOC family protein [Spirillospora sp. CA-253888]
MRLVCTLDCSEPDQLADFWAAVLDYRPGPYDPPYLGLDDPKGEGPRLLLQRVPEPKMGKNRMHLDLWISDMDAEVERVTGLGARVLRGPFDDSGTLTTVLADPEGNEFCLILHDFEGDA